jgi:hypothetical protein
MNSFGMKDDIDLAYESLNTEFTDEMYDSFDTETKKHVERIKSNAKILEDTLPELKGVYAQATRHDSTKYEEPELTAYVFESWVNKCKEEGVDYNPPSELPELLRVAKIHHLQNNKHHPEYWDENFDPSTVSQGGVVDESVEADGTAMDSISIAEMVCDAFTEAQFDSGSDNCDGKCKMELYSNLKLNESQLKLIQECTSILQKQMDIDVKSNSEQKVI